MIENTTTGPRLRDEVFFANLVDTTRPGLEEIPAAMQRGDLAMARSLFAAEVRRTLQPEKLLSTRREFREGSFLHPGETTEEAAERALRLELISCGTAHQFDGEVDWTANPTHNQYREWTWQLNRHPEWGLFAEQYRLTGDERFAEGFVRMFHSWVERALVPENANGHDTKCWRTIEAGIRMGGVWQVALHTFYNSPHFTDDVLVDWYKSVWEHGWRLRNFHTSGNWLIMEMNGLAQIGLLYPQLRDASDWKQYAFDRLSDELAVQLYPDGFQYELSTGYHQVVINNYEWLWNVCEAYEEPVPSAFRDGLERAYTTLVRVMMPDGRGPDLNDGKWGEVAPSLKSAVKRYPERKDFLWVYSHGAEGEPPAETSCDFQYAGYYVMRSGWERDAIWGLLDGGPFGYGHQHEDKLNLLIHAYGKLLLTEGGNYAYDGSEMRQYVLSTRSHNTIRVDGHDQNRRLNFSRKDVDINALAGAEWHTSDEYDLVEARYDEGYGPEADRTVAHDRRVIFLKHGTKTPGPCFLVIDRLVPSDAEPHAYEALWHLNAGKVEAHGLGVASRDTDDPNLTILPAGFPEMQVDVVSGQTSPEWQGWHSVRGGLQGGYEALPTAIYKLDATGPVRIVSLLYPTRPGEACPVTEVVADSKVHSTSVRLILDGGQTLDLDEGDFTST